MKRVFRKFFARRPLSVRPRANGFRPRLEALEARDLMAVASTSYAALIEGAVEFPSTYTAAQKQPLVPIAPMMLTNIVGTLPRGDVDVLHLKLSAGQEVMADINTASATMTPLDSNGQPVPGALSLVDKGEPALTFTAPAAGDYYLKMSPAAGTTRDVTYQIDLEETGLANSMYDSGALNRSWLQRGDGNMYAFLQQGTLDIVGPTGYGFSLTGQWQQTTASNKGLVSSTYTATGNIGLVTPLGQVPIKLPSAFHLVLTTYANPFGQVAGAVKSVAVTGSTTGMNVPTLSPSSLIAQLGKQFGLDASTPAGVPFTISVAPGSALHDTGAPLDAAVPYLNFHIGHQLSLNYDGTEVSPTMKGSNGVSVDLVIEPSDPMVYIDVAGLPGIKDMAVGVSRHGRFAFQPDNAPQRWQGSLFGHVFTNVAVNLAQLTDNEVPVSVQGSTLINLDSISSSGWQTGGTVSGLLKGNILTGLKQLQGFSVGINGKLDLTLAADSKNTGAGLDLSLPAVKGTVIYNGTTNTVYFHGSQPSIFSQIPYVKNSPLLSILGKDTGTIDGALGPKIQTATVSGNDAYNTVGWTATIDSKGVHAGFNVSAPGLGNVVSLSGNCYYNGVFNFTGQVQVSLPHVPSWAQLSSQLLVTVDNRGVTGTVDLTIGSGLPGAGLYWLSGTLDWGNGFDWKIPLNIPALQITGSLEVSTSNGVSLTLNTPTYVATLAADGSIAVKDLVAGTTQSYGTASQFVTSLSQSGGGVSQDLQNIGNYVTSIIPHI
jgi:hypothetical protein